MGKAFANGAGSCIIANIRDTIIGAILHALSMTCSMHACLSQRVAMDTGSHMDARMQSSSLEC